VPCRIVSTTQNLSLFSTFFNYAPPASVPTLSSNTPNNALFRPSSFKFEKLVSLEIRLGLGFWARLIRILR
jgi:hypothetical protein